MSGACEVEMDEKFIKSRDRRVIVEIEKNSCALGCSSLYWIERDWKGKDLSGRRKDE